MKNYHPITDGMTIIHYNSIARNISNPEKVPNTEMHFKYPVILRIYSLVSRGSGQFAAIHSGIVRGSLNYL